jgi:hypothetical protein
LPFAFTSAPPASSSSTTFVRPQAAA